MIEKLLAEGIVIEDPDDAEKVIFNVPIHIKKIAVEMGGFEAFATQGGWEPLISDESGNRVPNSSPAHETCKKMVWDFVRNIFKEIMLQKLRVQAEAEAQQKVNALL